MNKTTNALLTIFLGYLGIHKFYQKKYAIGIVYLLTGGLFYLGWIYDIIMLVVDALRGSNKKDNKQEPQNIETITRPKLDYQEETQRVETVYAPGVKISFGYYGPEEEYDERDYLRYKRVRNLVKDFVVLDFETTGYSKDVDKIIQIGAVRYRDFQPVAEYDELVNPERKLPKKIEELTGITDDMLEFELTIDDQLPDLIEFIGDDVIVAHNASFDMGFLLQNMHDCDIEYKEFRVIDTLQLARKYINTENHKLETLKKFLNLDYQSHNSIDDCYACAAVYKYCYDLAMEEKNRG